MLSNLLLFVVGFFLLIKGADWLVDGASSIAKKFKVSNLVIGLTVVSFGTSLPEMVVNLFASAQGNTDLAIANILGSNAANILLILGIAAVIYPLTVTKGTIWKEIPFSLLAAVALWILGNDVLLNHMDKSVLTRGDGMILMCFFIIFIYYIYSLAKKNKAMEEVSEEVKVKNYKAYLYLIGGIIGLSIGGSWVVDAAVSIASAFHISQSLIGLTIVALGTSLPELMTSAVAAYKHNAEIAVGNAVGSNIFNIFWVLGLSAVIKPLPFSAGSNLDVLVVIGATLILFVWMFVGKKHRLDRWQGGIFIGLYVVYIVLATIRG